MTQEFPPQSNKQAEIETILSVFASVLESRSACYVSTPMTTGRVFAQPSNVATTDRSVSDALRESRRNMIHCNYILVRALAEELRRSLASLVIDPTAITELPGWSQSDYRVLWSFVIKRYVHTVIFVEGWQYSDGCCYEFLIAHQTGAKTKTPSLEEISIAQGIHLIREAINELQEMNRNTAFLKAVTSELERCA